MCANVTEWSGLIAGEGRGRGENPRVEFKGRVRQRAEIAPGRQAACDSAEGRLHRACVSRGGWTPCPRVTGDFALLSELDGGRKRGEGQHGPYWLWRWMLLPLASSTCRILGEDL